MRLKGLARPEAALEAVFRQAHAAQAVGNTGAHIADAGQQVLIVGKRDGVTVFDAVPVQRAFYALSYGLPGLGGRNIDDIARPLLIDAFANGFRGTAHGTDQHKILNFFHAVSCDGPTNGKPSG